MTYGIEQLMALIQGENKISKTLLYITNPDGSPRWIWPSDMNAPEFLKFYNIGSTKAHIYATLIRLVFLLRIQSFIFNKVIISIPTSLGDQWVLFTGTPGVNRKMVMYKQGAIIKIPVGVNAISSLENEKNTLAELSKSTFSTFSHPQNIEVTGFEFCQSAFENDHHRSAQFTNVHKSALDEIFHTTSAKMPLSQSITFNHSMTLLQNLENDPKMPFGLYGKLFLLKNEIQTNKLTEFGFAHGDFTPWNIFANNQNLFIYDWEAAQDLMPKGFDAFHFIIQQSIMVEKHPWNVIEQSLTRILVDENHLFDSKKEMQRYLKLYLLLQIARSMTNYVAQEQWHPQIYWMIDTWNAALDTLTGTTSHRQAFINSLFDHLYPMEYAGLKVGDNHPSFWSEESDIDILTKKKNFIRITQFCKNSPLTSDVVITSKSFMKNVAIYFHDGSFLSLDMIHQLKRKKYIFLNADKLLKRSMVNPYGIKILSHLDDARYIAWFYALNNSKIPTKYEEYKKYLLESFKFEDQALLAFHQGNESSQAILESHIKNKNGNRAFSGLKNKIFYYLDTTKSFFQNKGMVITFSGVDGAGKSTIIENIKYKIEKNLRKEVIVLRHRPSILPIISAWKHGKEKAELISVSKLPRTGNNKSSLSSMLRFGYYYIDYILGQFYVYIRYVKRGNVVLYDRYYFDFINDGRRSNIHFPPSLIKFGYHFLLKPELNFFLYADAHTILSRKQELNKETIETLTTNYRDLFDDFENKYKASSYKSINNEELQDTISYIFENIKSKIKRA
ncbi:MAG: hypothetical protein IPO26_07945 [Saprospiraceae bacterium]|nr:hypothetical protein [Saprospiraceae bacterium]